MEILDKNTYAFGGYYEAFTKTIDLIYFTLTKKEEEYLSLVKTLKSQAIEAVSEVLGLLIKAFIFEYRYNDYLGIAYQWLSHSDKRMGQFFTPWNVAYMMAQMNLGDVKSQIEKAKAENRKISISDPTCGSGVMLLAAKRLIIEQGGLQGLDYFEFYGQDLDAICVKMCQIQMMLTDYRYMRDLMLVTYFEAKKELEERV